MKYFIVVGEASGDLHAANLMRALAAADTLAEFHYVGGPEMRRVGGHCLLPCEELAYMGVWDVLVHYREIRHAATLVQQELLRTSPDVVICVDYAGFNFRYVLPFVKEQLPQSKVVYYIPPKVWAWKKRRIATLRSLTDLVLCIFPFEVAYLAQNNLPQARYVGNPSLDAIRSYWAQAPLQRPSHLPAKYIALLPGSRISEVRKNLPLMLQTVAAYPEYSVVVAASTSLPESLYCTIPGIDKAQLCRGETYTVLQHAEAALVTSGTATLETALLGTPQVIGYAIGVGSVANWVFEHFFTIPYISLVNLIAGREVVPEMYGGRFRLAGLVQKLGDVLPGSVEREVMMKGYNEIKADLSTERSASEMAAQEILDL